MGTWKGESRMSPSLTTSVVVVLNSRSSCNEPMDLWLEGSWRQIEGEFV